MAANKNPYDKKVFNRVKFESLKQKVDESIQNLNINLYPALRSGLTLEQIKEIHSDEDFKRFIETAKREYVKTLPFVPMEEKMRIAETYQKVYNDYHLQVVNVCSVLNDANLVIDYDESGTPHINKDASVENNRQTCYDTIDNEKLFRLRNALIAFANSFDTFENTLSLEGVNIRENGVIFKNDNGGTTIIKLSDLANIFAGSNAPLDLDDYAHKLFWLIVLRSA